MARLQIATTLPVLRDGYRSTNYKFHHFSEVTLGRIRRVHILLGRTILSMASVLLRN